MHGTAHELRTCRLRGCGRPVGHRSKTGACCGAHAIAAEMRRTARAQGYVPLVDLVELLEVDRRILEQLHDNGTIEGKRVDSAHIKAVIWLSRRSVAAWLWSRPRCVLPTCGRRVLGNGPGCTRHPHHGKRHSEERREKMSESARSGPLVERICEWCGAPFTLRPGEARLQPGRFHTRECMRAWLHNGENAVDRHARQRASLLGWFKTVAATKAERRLMDVDDIVRALPRDVRRSEASILRHIAEGVLAATPNEFGRHWFTRGAFDAYVAWLRAHADGRCSRFNPTTPERVQFRLDWTGARFGRTSLAWQRANGQLVSLTASRSLAARQIERQVAALWDSPLTHEEIGGRLSISPRYVRMIAQRLGLPKRRSGRRARN